MTRKHRVNVAWNISEEEYIALKAAARSFGFKRVDAYIREIVRIHLKWPKGK